MKSDQPPILQITPLSLHQKLSDGEDIRLVDVREPWEHEIFNIGGQLIPFSEVMEKASGLERNKPVVVYCKVGMRSQLAIQRLQRLGFNNLINLQGGMEAWKQEIGDL